MPSLDPGVPPGTLEDSHVLQHGAHAPKSPAGQFPEYVSTSMEWRMHRVPQGAWLGQGTWGYCPSVSNP